VGTSQDIHATREIWQFFRQQSLPGTSGVSRDLSNLAVDAFPNPSAGTISVSFDQDGAYQTSVFTPAGQKVAVYTTTGRVGEYDFSAFPPGTYILQITDGVRLATLRWVKL
jgi:hypothetical protein